MTFMSDIDASMAGLAHKELRLYLLALLVLAAPARPVTSDLSELANDVADLRARLSDLVEVVIGNEADDQEKQRLIEDADGQETDRLSIFSTKALGRPGLHEVDSTDPVKEERSETNQDGMRGDLTQRSSSEVLSELLVGRAGGVDVIRESAPRDLQSSRDVPEVPLYSNVVESSISIGASGIRRRHDEDGQERDYKRMGREDFKIPEDIGIRSQSDEDHAGLTSPALDPSMSSDERTSRSDPLSSRASIGTYERPSTGLSSEGPGNLHSRKEEAERSDPLKPYISKQRNYQETVGRGWIDSDGKAENDLEGSGAILTPTDVPALDRVDVGFQGFSQGEQAFRRETEFVRRNDVMAVPADPRESERGRRVKENGILLDAVEREELSRDSTVNAPSEDDGDEVSPLAELDTTNRPRHARSSDDSEDMKVRQERSVAMRRKSARDQWSSSEAKGELEGSLGETVVDLPSPSFGAAVEESGDSSLLSLLEQRAAKYRESRIQHHSRNMDDKNGNEGEARKGRTQNENLHWEALKRLKKLFGAGSTVSMSSGGQSVGVRAPVDNGRLLY